MPGKLRPLATEPPRERDRLTLVSMIYHEHLGEDPTGLDLRASMMLEEQEELYNRRFKVDEEWKALDLGWVETPGLVAIENTVGKRYAVNPTEEQKLEDAQRIIEVSYTKDSDQSFLVPPGLFSWFLPSNAGGLYLRSRHGLATGRLTIISR